MVEGGKSWEDVPSYYDVTGVMYNYFIKNVEGLQRSNYSFPWTAVDDAAKYLRIDIWDVLLVMVMALIWTGVRHLCTKWIFKPLGKYLDLTISNQNKMPESAWKFLFCFTVWTSTLYVVELKGSYAFFRRPSTVWDDWDLEMPLPPDFYVLYAVQCSFYLHSLYACIFEDVWRRDSSMMVAHHILTLLLLVLSYALRCHKIGVLVLLFHDISDIQLEFTKLMVYFKIQGGKLVKAYELVADVGFCFFAATWYLSRLYWYPLKALNSACSVLTQTNIPLQFGLAMNVLLWMLLAMNINWFLFILGFMWRIATGQMKEVDDTREYDVIERSNQHPDGTQTEWKKNVSAYNGIAGNKRSLSSTNENKAKTLLNGESQYPSHETQARARR